MQMSPQRLQQLGASPSPPHRVSPHLQAHNQLYGGVMKSESNPVSRILSSNQPQFPIKIEPADFGYPDHHRLTSPPSSYALPGALPAHVTASPQSQHSPASSTSSGDNRALIAQQLQQQQQQQQQPMLSRANHNDRLAALSRMTQNAWPDRDQVSMNEAAVQIISDRLVAQPFRNMQNSTERDVIDSIQRELEEYTSGARSNGVPVTSCGVRVDTSNLSPVSQTNSLDQSGSSISQQLPNVDMSVLLDVGHDGCPNMQLQQHQQQQQQQQQQPRQSHEEQLSPAFWASTSPGGSSVSSATVTSEQPISEKAILDFLRDFGAPTVTSHVLSNQAPETIISFNNSMELSTQQLRAWYDFINEPQEPVIPTTPVTPTSTSVNAGNDGVAASAALEHNDNAIRTAEQEFDSSYWLKPRLPSDNVRILQKHQQIAMQIAYAYQEFVRNGEEINRELTHDFFVSNRHPPIHTWPLRADMFYHRRLQGWLVVTVFETFENM